MSHFQSKEIYQCWIYSRGEIPQLSQQALSQLRKIMAKFLYTFILSILIRNILRLSFCYLYPNSRQTSPHHMQSFHLWMLNLVIIRFRWHQKMKIPSHLKLFWKLIATKLFLLDLKMLVPLTSRPQHKSMISFITKYGVTLKISWSKENKRKTIHMT